MDETIRSESIPATGCLSWSQFVCHENLKNESDHGSLRGWHQSIKQHHG